MNQVAVALLALQVFAIWPMICFDRSATARSRRRRTTCSRGAARSGRSPPRSSARAGPEPSHAQRPSRPSSRDGGGAAAASRRSHPLISSHRSTIAPHSARSGGRSYRESGVTPSPPPRPPRAVPAAAPPPPLPALRRFSLPPLAAHPPPAHPGCFHLSSCIHALRPFSLPLQLLY